MNYNQFKKLKVKHDINNLIIENGFIRDRRTLKIDERNYLVYPIAKTNIHYYIVCPYCGEIHTHGSQGGGGERVPNCTNSHPNIYTIG